MFTVLVLVAMELYVVRPGNKKKKAKSKPAAEPLPTADGNQVTFA